jgi:hypothetical protein
MILIHFLTPTRKQPVPHYEIHRDCETFDLVLPRPFPMHDDVDIARLDDQDYRDALYMDDLIRHARQKMTSIPGDPYSMVASSTYYGLLYRAIVFWNATALNAFYLPCPHLRRQDNRVPPITIQDTMCPVSGTLTTVTDSYFCILVSYYDFDRRRYVLDQVVSTDAHMFQVEIDRQQGRLDACGTQHGTRHTYRGTCLY